MVAGHVGGGAIFAGYDPFGPSSRAQTESDALIVSTPTFERGNGKCICIMYSTVSPQFQLEREKVQSVHRRVVIIVRLRRFRD